MTIKGYHYLLGFLAGVFLMNVLPHFINGIIGNPFPTPFAEPPGKGLSPPVINIVWATINFAIGSVFFYFSRIVQGGKRVWISLAGGAILMAFYLASYFGQLFQG